MQKNLSERVYRFFVNSITVLVDILYFIGLVYDYNAGAGLYGFFIYILTFIRYTIQEG